MVKAMVSCRWSQQNQSWFGGFSPYPPEKWWSSSVGMIFPFPTEWKVMKNSMVPVTTKQNPLIWVCLKMLCTPFYPMVLLIIIPFLNGYFIGNINPTFSDKPICPIPKVNAWIFSRDLGPAIDLAGQKKTGLPRARGPTVGRFTHEKWWINGCWIGKTWSLNQPKLRLTIQNPCWTTKKEGIDSYHRFLWLEKKLCELVFVSCFDDVGWGSMKQQMIPWISRRKVCICSTTSTTNHNLGKRNIPSKA